MFPKFLIGVALLTHVFSSCIPLQKRNDGSPLVVGGKLATHPFRSTVLILGKAHEIPRTGEFAGLYIPPPDYPQVETEKVAVSFCTGAIVTGGYLLTAAHCVLNKDGSIASAFKKGATIWISKEVDFTNAISKKHGKISKRTLDINKTNALEVTVLETAKIQQYYATEQSSRGENAAPDVAIVKLKNVAGFLQAQIADGTLVPKTHIAYGGYGCRTEQERNKKKTQESAQDGSLPVQLRIDEKSEVLDATKVLPTLKKVYFQNYFLSPKPDNAFASSDSSTCFGDSGMPIYRGNENVIAGVHRGSLHSQKANEHTRLDINSTGGKWLRKMLPANAFIP